MNLHQIVKQSILPWLKKTHDPLTTDVIDYTEQRWSNGEIYSRVYYAHSGPYDNLRTFVFHGSLSTMLAQITVEW